MEFTKDPIKKGYNLEGTLFGGTCSYGSWLRTRYSRCPKTRMIKVARTLYNDLRKANGMKVIKDWSVYPVDTFDSIIKSKAYAIL